MPAPLQVKLSESEDITLEQLSKRKFNVLMQSASGGNHGSRSWGGAVCGTCVRTL
ncbi:MAG: hypothetical protein F6J98_21755 [Moorea sp. SIO4G2]|nr:hypothetical protein [Moorena sp. SIO4G2]